MWVKFFGIMIEANKIIVLWTCLTKQMVWVGLGIKFNMFGWQTYFCHGGSEQQSTRISSIFWWAASSVVVYWIPFKFWLNMLLKYQQWEQTIIAELLLVHGNSKLFVYITWMPSRCTEEERGRVASWLLRSCSSIPGDQKTNKLGVTHWTPVAAP